MGHGDFKLFAAIGAWLGVQMLPVVLALACITCLLVGVLPEHSVGRAGCNRDGSIKVPAREIQKYNFTGSFLLHPVRFPDDSDRVRGDPQLRRFRK